MLSSERVKSVIDTTSSDEKAAAVEFAVQAVCIGACRKKDVPCLFIFFLLCGEPINPKLIERLHPRAGCCGFCGIAKVRD